MELIESLSKCLLAAGLSGDGNAAAAGAGAGGGGGGVPIFYVGCAARDSLALAATSMEFLSR